VYVAPHCWNTEKDHDISIISKSFENMEQFKYLEMTIRNQNSIVEEIKRSMNLTN
jgi:hypothetical protein